MNTFAAPQPDPMKTAMNVQTKEYVRLFAGIAMPEKYKQLLADLQRRMKHHIIRPPCTGLNMPAISWACAETWHLTLRFIGNIPTQNVQSIIDNCHTISWKPFTITPGAGGTFPSLHTKTPTPSVLWLALKQGEHEVSALAKSVNQALQPIGIVPEKRSYQPHLTVARIRRNNKPDKKAVASSDATALATKNSHTAKPYLTCWKSILAEAGQTVWPPYRVDRFVLWQSRLTSHGAGHTPLAEFHATI
ncbi:RNA 2',3'-cyclic phosphodiesterase [Oleidesulfovibrio sp.]|uniref:RNA 2',3'-cyclic phosphodiesterase n=1 Tax=Oleidesulfovibrio sp. TaxID=2909707 RepID=UPI003A86B1F7